MANKRNIHFDLILEKLLAGWHTKAIAAFLDVSEATITTIKRRYITVSLSLKDRIPDPNQGSFFYNFWADRRD